MVNALDFGLTRTKKTSIDLIGSSYHNQEVPDKTDVDDPIRIFDMPFILWIRIKVDLVKHLVTKTIEKNCAQRFDDSMSSFSNKK